MSCRKTFIMCRCTIYINGININTYISYKQYLAITCILNNTSSLIKNNFITLITQLTNAKQVVCQVFNQVHIFNKSIGYITDIANTNDLSFWIISKGNVSTVLYLSKTWKLKVIPCHVSWISTIQVPLIFSFLWSLRKKFISFKYPKLLGSLNVSNSSFYRT